MSVEIRIGDVRALLRALPDNSVDMVVTSPPYWGLRSYLPDKHPNKSEEIGLEATFREHVDNIVEVFNEVRRVLKPDGTCWVNYGDGYSSTPNGRSADDSKAAGNDDRTFRDKPIDTTKEFPAKQRMMMPARLAIALQESGWWIRDEIVWAKQNPMPSSVQDRTCPSHEMLYMLTKSPRYYYDGEAIEEPIAESSAVRYAQPTVDDQKGGSKSDAFETGFIGGRVRSRRPNVIIKDLAAKARKKNNQAERHVASEKWQTRHDGWAEIAGESVTRKKRSVWSLPIEPFKDAHFATFPTALVEPCIKAGSKPGGLVFDPFGGSGTVGLVADRLGRECLMFELNEASADIAVKRLRADAGMLIDIVLRDRGWIDAPS